MHQRVLAISALGDAFHIIILQLPISKESDIVLFPIGEPVCGTYPIRFLSAHRNVQAHDRLAHHK